MASRAANRARRLDGLAAGPPAEALPPAVAVAFTASADAFAYSSGLAAAVGGGLTLAVGRALGSESVWAAASLVGSAVLFIYGIDRLRDVEGDRVSSPMRTGFVLRHRRGLRLAILFAGLCVASLLATAPAPVIALCVVLGGVGLLHRRLKQRVPWKIGYVAAAWTAACVGIPWLAVANAEDGGTAIWAALLIGSTLVANLVASNLRAGKSRRWAAGWPPEAAIAAARLASVGAAAAAIAAPDSITPLVWIPAAEAVALSFFRPTERFGHLAVDGALLVGAVLAIVHGAWIR